MHTKKHFISSFVLCITMDFWFIRNYFKMCIKGLFKIRKLKLFQCFRTNERKATGSIQFWIVFRYDPTIWFWYMQSSSTFHTYIFQYPVWENDSFWVLLSFALITKNQRTKTNNHFWMVEKYNYEIIFFYKTGLVNSRQDNFVQILHSYKKLDGGKNYPRR